MNLCILHLRQYIHSFIHSFGRICFVHLCICQCVFSDSVWCLVFHALYSIVGTSLLDNKMKCGDVHCRYLSINEWPHIHDVRYRCHQIHFGVSPTHSGPICAATCCHALATAERESNFIVSIECTISHFQRSVAHSVFFPLCSGETFVICHGHNNSRINSSKWCQQMNMIRFIKNSISNFTTKKFQYFSNW